MPHVGLEKSQYAFLSGMPAGEDYYKVQPMQIIEIGCRRSSSQAFRRYRAPQFSALFARGRSAGNPPGVFLWPCVAD